MARRLLLAQITFHGGAASPKTKLAFMVNINKITFNSRLAEPINRRMGV
jgi:hypothetical protein